MGLEIGRLGKAFATVVKGTHIRPVSSVDPDVRAEVEVQREPLTTPFKGTLRRRVKLIINHAKLSLKTGNMRLRLHYTMVLILCFDLLNLMRSLKSLRHLIQNYRCIPKVSKQLR